MGWPRQAISRLLLMQAPRPSLADEAPLQDPGTALTGSGVQQSPSMGEGNSSMAAWGGVLSAIDVYTPPAPVSPRTVVITTHLYPTIHPACPHAPASAS